MNTKRALAASFLVLLSACSAECSCGGDNDDDGNDDTTSGQGGSGITVTVGNGGSGGEGTTAGTGGAGGEGGSAPTGDASIRLGHFSPDSAGVNVCLVPAAGEPIGPIVEGGFEFAETTDYAGIDSGSYGIILTAQGADDCGTPIAEFDAVEIAEGDSLTVAVIGLAAGEDDEALSIAVYSDDLTPPEAGNVKARFVHAAVTAPAVDVGYYDSDDVFVPIWSNVAYPEDGGYVEIEAFDTLPLVALIAGTETESGLGATVNGTDGATVEGFALGSLATGFQVLVVETPPAE